MQRENESWSACDEPIREENGFDKKKAEETYVGLVGLFLQETMPFLVRGKERFGEEGEMAPQNREEGETTQKNRETGEPAWKGRRENVLKTTWHESLKP